MKRLVPILVVIALVLTVIGVANAGQLTKGNNTAGDSSLFPKSIVVTSSGFYNIGGVCTVDIEYKVEGLKNNIDSEVPLRESQNVPWEFSPRELFYPGCHVVHFKNDKEVKQADTNDGSWQICFGNRAELDEKIYYYADKPDNGVREWIELPTVVQDTYICTDAIYSGVYMPAGLIEPTPRPGGVGEGTPSPTPLPGSIQPPPANNRITESGSYSIGGICTLIVIYKLPNLSDDVWVEPLTQNTQTIPFPRDDDVLYLPGCHVVHYKPSLTLETTDAMGEWEICFAERPGKLMTIYYYTDDLNSVIPPWTPLPTTTENGQACAPANWTGVYVPAGR